MAICSAGKKSSIQPSVECIDVPSNAPRLSLAMSLSLFLVGDFVLVHNRRDWKHGFCLCLKRCSWRPSWMNEHFSSGHLKHVSAGHQHFRSVPLTKCNSHMYAHWRLLYSCSALFEAKYFLLSKHLNPPNPLHIKYVHDNVFHPLRLNITTVTFQS